MTTHRKLAAILAADAAGYSKLMADDEGATLRSLNEARSLFRERIEAHSGRLIDTVGDSVLAEFASPVEAVSAAVDIQRELADRNAQLPEHRRMQFRIGINLGDVIEQEDGTIYGDGVNVAARLQALAEPRGICISGTAFDQVEGKLPEDEYFSDGLTEELISRLSRVAGLDVIARTSVMQYKRTNKSITDVGRDLNVNNVLEGSVRKAGDKVRITVQLIDVASQAHLWSADYDHDLKDIFTTQSDISGKVAEALHLQLVAAGTSAGQGRNGSDPKTYALYLKGRYHAGKLTPDGLKRSIEYFEEALATDPNDANIWAALARTYALVGWWAYASPKESFPKAKAAAERALSIDAKHSEAAVALGMVRFLWDWLGAEQAYQRAIELNPGSADAHLFYGVLLKALTRNDRAAVEIRRANELDPLNLMASAELGWVAYYGGRIYEAVQGCRRTLEMDPNYLFALSCLQMALALKKGIVEMTYQGVEFPFDLRPPPLIERPKGSGVYVRFSEDGRRGVLYLGHQKPNAESEITPVGTGFLVHIGGPAGGYLVTAGHVAMELGDVFDIRLNQRKIKQGKIDHIEKASWFFHPTDETCDVAVMPYEPPAWADKTWLPYKSFLSEDTLKAKNTGPGDFAYVVGLLHFMHGTMRNMPAVHTGHIVLMPEGEKIPITNWRTDNHKKPMYIDAYLVQANALPGSSGSPVYIRRSLNTEMLLPKVQNEEIRVSIPGSYWFLGVWRGAWFGKASDGLNVPENAGKVPVGLGTVVPATALSEVLNQPKLMKMRENKQAAEFAKVADEPTSLNPKRGDQILRAALNTSPLPKPKRKGKASRAKVSSK